MLPSPPVDPHHILSALTTVLARTQMLIRQLESGVPLSPEVHLARLRLVEEQTRRAIDELRVLVDHVNGPDRVEPE